MKLRVERLWKKPAYTVGRLFVDEQFFCNTLEDTVRDLSNEGIWQNRHPLRRI